MYRAHAGAGGCSHVIALCSNEGKLLHAGGTMTVSNIGSIGGTYASPLVNVPEAAILALGRCALCCRQQARV